MNRAEVVFKAIDVLFHPFQNCIKIKDTVIEKDISYDDRYPQCKADFVYKKSEEKLPVLVNIHGGGFVMGDKKHRRSISELYADKGWFVININYRLAPKYPFPAFMEDIFALLNLIPTIADKYNLDLSRLVLTGDSAGAHASAQVLACIHDETLRKELGLPEVSVKPTGAVCFCGIYDVIAATKLKVPFGIARSVVESTVGESFKKDYSDINKYKYLKQIAPIHYVNSNWCPIMLTYSQKDIFCGGQGEMFYKKLKEVGVPCMEAHSTKLIDNHCYHFNYWTKASKETLKAVFDFLEKIKNNEAIA
ncbi:MAG: alpha/beta hydrolase [Clostridia bacterium]|nr:alpha/beta hydrolase [Clostridia bacterium]